MRTRPEHLERILRRLEAALKDIMIQQASLDASVAALTAAVKAAGMALQAITTPATPDTVVLAFQQAVDAQTAALTAEIPATPAPAKPAV